jgi:hypothetical protein
VCGDVGLDAVVEAHEMTDTPSLFDTDFCGLAAQLVTPTERSR